MTAQPQDHKKALADFPDTVDIPTSAGDVTLPHITKIPSGVFRKARKIAEDHEQFFYILEEVLGESSPQLELLDSINLIEVAQVYLKWTQGAPVGESVSSSS